MLLDLLGRELVLPPRSPNQRFERTRSSGLRPPARAAQPWRWAARSNGR